MWYLFLGVAVFLLPGAWAARRAPKELTDSGRISVATFFAVFVTYVGHGAVTILAAWNGVWPVPLPREVTIITGAFALALGLVVLRRRPPSVPLLSPDLGTRRESPDHVGHLSVFTQSAESRGAPGVDRYGAPR